uniref:Uncharacterized protein n=1 Tax=Aegilops tauschii TaxID=37682 RepID=M8D2B0_AEGTA
MAPPAAPRSGSSCSSSPCSCCSSSPPRCAEAAADSSAEGLRSRAAGTLSTSASCSSPSSAACSAAVGATAMGEPPGPAAPAPKSHLRVSPAAAATPEPSTEDVWASFNNCGGVGGLASPEWAWRSYDDAERSRTRRDERPDRARDADRSLRRTSSDVKTIPVDTYEVRTRPLPQDARRRRRSVERLPKMDEVEEERTHPAETETLATPARSRTWSPEELDATLLGMASAPPAPAPPPQPRRRRRSLERLPEMVEVEEKRTRPTETRATPARSRTWSPEELGATLLEMASAEPPPAPPQQPRRRRRSLENLPTMEEVEKEITPAPAPVRTRPPRASAHPQQQIRAQGYPQQPPLYPRRGVVYYAYPLPPPSPPMPPPPPPPPMLEGEEEVPSVTASPAPSYCASPDVNTKADNFIERFRAGLKLEKINSYREKLQIQEGSTVTMAEEDGEFMIIGSLFEDDDDDMSLPETPATATAAAVAVGF